MTTRYRVEHNLPRTPKDDIIRKEEREKVLLDNAISWCERDDIPDWMIIRDLHIMLKELNELRKGISKDEG